MNTHSECAILRDKATFKKKKEKQTAFYIISGREEFFKREVVYRKTQPRKHVVNGRKKDLQLEQCALSLKYNF